MITALIAVLLQSMLVEPVPIESPDRLAHTFAALQRREARPPSGRVRITHLGDSHIAADLWTGPLRSALQARFGDGGRGFVLAGRPWTSYWQEHALPGIDGPWRVDGLRGGLDDGWFGPGTCSVAADDPDAEVSLSVSPKSDAGRGATSVDVHVLRQPGGGCFEVRVDGQPVRRFSTRGPWVEPTFVRVPLPTGTAKVTVHPVAGGETRLLGLSLEAEQGLLYDALGINGAKANRLLRLDPTGLRDGLRRLDPTLLIISYGTNELFDDDLEPSTYADRLEAVLTALRAAAPDADCLLTGPPDALIKRRHPPPLIEAVYGIQRALAEAHGCAFWDARSAMGGPGSIRAWRRAGLAQRDFVHFTRDGYRQLAEAFLSALLGAYDAWITPR
ncbi:MAG: SGNH/GDSL hydrolase family protein [Myxococcales bacterium]|nr:SGNH/GDSL hydrolase family protein [Myxococcales bacterium]